MCGIAGFTGIKNIKKLNTMLEMIEHRGRDGRTLYFSDGVHLGMNRLAIIDLTKNLYPMQYKHYALVFNGEIYNYQDIRLQLKKKHIRFQTNCDAEVILPLYDLYGFNAFSMLEGMFAISLIDTEKHHLILVRDKSGEKPLYWTQTDKGFVFASEMKALLVTDSHNTLNTECLPQYLTQGFVFSPKTLVEKIYKIPPSGYLVYKIKSNTVESGQYWKPTLQTKYENRDVDTLETLLQKSVRLRLIADVPVGCFLSGGIDSSLVTLFAAREKSNMHTYSVSFPGYTAEDESEYASYVAETLRTRHTVVTCTAQDVYKLIGNIGRLMDEPIVDPAVLPTFLMALEARKQVKVVLTGEGADELFGGYDRYRRQLAVESIRSVFSTILPLFKLAPINRIRTISKSIAERYSAQNVWNDMDKQRLLSTESRLPVYPYLQEFGKMNPLLAIQLTDYRGYMADQLCMKIDKSTMAANLEARAPYLDTDIMQFALNLPNNQKIRYGHGKYILKQLAQQHFPKDFVWRPKHGFDIPLAQWFREDLRSFVDQSVKDLQIFGGLFNIDYYTQIVREHMNASRDHSGKIWSIVVLIRWMMANNISIES